MTSPASGHVARPAWRRRAGTVLEQGADYQASAQWLQNVKSAQIDTFSPIGCLDSQSENGHIWMCVDHLS